MQCSISRCSKRPRRYTPALVDEMRLKGKKEIKKRGKLITHLWTRNQRRICSLPAPVKSWGQLGICQRLSQICPSSLRRSLHSPPLPSACRLLSIDLLPRKQQMRCTPFFLFFLLLDGECNEFVWQWGDASRSANQHAGYWKRMHPSLHRKHHVISRSRLWSTSVIYLTLCGFFFLAYRHTHSRAHSCARPRSPNVVHTLPSCGHLPNCMNSLLFSTTRGRCLLKV